MIGGISFYSGEVREVCEKIGIFSGGEDVEPYLTL